MTAFPKPFQPQDYRGARMSTEVLTVFYRKREEVGREIIAYRRYELIEEGEPVKGQHHSGTITQVVRGFKSIDRVEAEVDPDTLDDTIVQGGGS